MYKNENEILGEKVLMSRHARSAPMSISAKKLGYFLLLLSVILCIFYYVCLYMMLGISSLVDLLSVGFKIITYNVWSDQCLPFTLVIFTGCIVAPIVEETGLRAFMGLMAIDRCKRDAQAKNTTYTIEVYGLWRRVIIAYWVTYLLFVIFHYPNVWYWHELLVYYGIPVFMVNYILLCQVAAYMFLGGVCTMLWLKSVYRGKAKYGMLSYIIHALWNYLTLTGLMKRIAVFTLLALYFLLALVYKEKIMFKLMYSVTRVCGAFLILFTSLSFLIKGL